MLSLSQHCVQVQVQVQLDGGMSESCLPRAEKLLEENRRILSMIRHRLTDEPYHCVMDAVLCCFLPDLKKACLAYYAGEGPQLRKLFSDKGIRAIDAHLCNCILTLKATHKALTLQYPGVQRLGFFDAALVATGWVK